MAAKTGITYRYSIAFPRVFDGPRLDWPPDILDRFLGLAGVIDASFPEWAAAWRRPSDEGPRSESRRRLIFVDTVNAKAASAEATHAGILALAREIKAQLGGGPVVVVRWETEAEVL